MRERAAGAVIDTWVVADNMRRGDLGNKEDGKKK